MHERDVNSYLYSAYPRFAGQNNPWLDTDSAEVFSKNNKHGRQSRNFLQELNWDKRNPTYKFNRDGFRAPEFNKDEPNIVFLGCSFTTGIGLNLSDTFSHHVSQSLGLQNYNLGRGGGSNKTAFRIGQHWIPKLKPKIVVLMSPDISRTELIIGDNPSNLGVHTREEQPALWGYLKSRMTNEENFKLECLANTLALEKISNDVGARFLQLDVHHDLIIPEEVDIPDLARDLQHPGRVTHKLTAEHILAKIHKA